MGSFTCRQFGFPGFWTGLMGESGSFEKEETSICHTLSSSRNRLGES